MRTLLLFVFALAFMGTTMAQKPALKAERYNKTAHPYAVTTIDNAVPNSTVANPVQISRPKATKATIDTTWFGSSLNAYTLLIPQQRCLWYDYNLNAIMATYRGNNNTAYPKMAYLTGNDLVNSYSLDHGVTWIKKTGSASGIRHRYPSGVLLNPTGNTDINNALSVMAGPQTDGSDWVNTYMSSVQYDGTHVDEQLDPCVMGELLRQGLTATEDNMVHFCGDGYAGDYTSSTLMLRNGELNAGGTIDWTSVDISLDDLITRSSDYTLNTFFGDAHMAWNNDGTVGYAFVRGSDIRPDDKPAWVPIIFKTLDGGATWDQLPYFDFSTLPEITDWIYPTWDEVTYKPMFTDFAITVDCLNKPHIFAVVCGAASADLDSLNYYWSVTYGGVKYHADNNYVEIWQDASDNWNAYHIDTCWTDDVDEDNSPYTSSSGNVGWDHRLQASRSYDGTHVFCTWGDSDYKFWGSLKYNLNPDLFLFGRSVTTGHILGPVNYTDGTDLWGSCYFHFTAPIAYESDPWVYQIPVTVEDIFSTGSSADNPVYHVYAKGITMDFSPFIGITENQKSISSVSNCYPNPSTGTAYFDVTTDRNSNVTLNVSNVAGQNIASKDYGVVLKGTHKLAIDNSNLRSGVYFCTITVGDQKFTNKMIVK